MATPDKIEKYVQTKLNERDAKKREEKNLETTTSEPITNVDTELTPQERLYEEMAYLAYHLHWPYDQLLNLEHPDRLRWMEEVSKINQRRNEA